MLVRFADKIYFYLSRCWNFLRPRRKLGLVSFVLLASFILVVWVAGAKVAHAITYGDVIDPTGLLRKVGGAAGGAAKDVLGDVAQALFNLMINLIMAVAGWFIKLTFFILAFVIEVAGYNGFIDSSAVIVGWVMVRDITNMFFVVVLLIISFGTILGLEQYEYKKLLVKLLLAAIIVNFSRIISGIIIDVAQVVMTTFVNGIAATASGNMVKMFGVDQIFSFSQNENLSSQVTGNGPIFLAAVASVTFAAIMMVTMLVFLFMLMARMVTLWILIVLSPFAFVLNVLPQTQTYAGQWWKEFGGNVVAGPIIAFFLWLSFVTVGAGNARDQIATGNPQAFTESSNPAETSTGITKIMTWAQMANFAIAIGMLLAGAKMAQQLGAAGGGMMAKAGEFGKKVAMTASGITAARWAGRGMAAGAKKAGAYGLGLAATPFKRMGRNIQSRVAAGYYDWVGRRTIAAGKIAKATAVDEKGRYVKKVKVPKRDAEGNIIKGEFEEKEVVQAGVRDWGRRMFSRARLALPLGYGAFKEEYSKDLATIAENKKGQLEHLASTSSLGVGLEKRKSEEWLQFLKDSGQDIKSGRTQRMIERREEITQAIDKGGDVDASLRALGLNDNEIVMAKSGRERLEKAVKGKAQAKITGEYTGAEKGRREAEAMEKYLGGKKGAEQEQKRAAVQAQTKQIEQQIAADKEFKELQAIYALIKDQGIGQKRQEALTAMSAKLESTKEMMDLQKKKATFLARAEEYRNPERQGGPDLLQATLAEQQAHSLELNRLKEVYKTAEIGANERANIAAQLIQKMQEARSIIEDGVSSPESKDKARDSLKSLIRQKDSLHDFSTTQSSYDAIREEEEELRQLGWTEPINNDNVARRFLSRRLGERIDTGGEVAALKEYRDLVGEDEYNVRMRQFGAHTKVQQAQGNAGAFVYKELPNVANGELTGLTDYEPIVRTGEEIVKEMSGWLKNSFIDTKKMLQAAGTRRLGEKPGSGSVLIDIKEDEAVFNAEALGTYTSQSIAAMGKRGFIGDLNGSAIEDKASLRRQLSAFAAKATNKQAFDALLNNLGDILKKLGMEQEELDEVWRSSGKSEVKPEKGKEAVKSEEKGERMPSGSREIDLE